MTTLVMSKRIAEVVDYFPGATWGSLPFSRLSYDNEFVRLQLQPLRAGNTVAVARALYARQPLVVLENGLLEVQGSPPRISAVLERKIALVRPQCFTVEIRWSPTRKHPTIFVLDPMLSTENGRGISHLYPQRHPDSEANAICVYPPHWGVWNPETGSQYILILWISAWLAAKQFWDATGQWLTAEASHSLPEILRDYREGDCHCLSGLPMMACHGKRGPGRLLNLGRRII